MPVLKGGKVSCIPVGAFKLVAEVIKFGCVFNPLNLFKILNSQNPTLAIVLKYS